MHVRFHIVVTPAPDEAERVVSQQVDAGLDWLYAHTVVFEPFPETGGYMIIETDSRASLDAMLREYPLNDTVSYEIRELVSVEVGFGVLRAAIVAHASRAEALA
jgi:hypothetical protein